MGSFILYLIKVELDGTISSIVPATANVDQEIVGEVVRTVRSAPKWDAPKNTKVDEPFTSNFTLEFKLPGKITNITPYVVSEEMPMYPGGDIELLKFITKNAKYPEAAKKAKTEGRVIVLFYVSTEGKAEGVTVLKGVDPLLDAEAVRVTSLLSGFKPGMNGGKPVNVWYMVPVTFSQASSKNQN
jgi:TonB family protein